MNNIKKLFVIFFAFILINCSFAEETVYTPDSSVRYAVGDLATLPEDIQPYIRYLSLYNFPINERRKVAQTVSFVINSLSRRKKIWIPVFVGASNETVIRINLRDYDINPKAWDNLGKKGSGSKPYPEPYFHAFIERINFDPVKKQAKERRVFTGRYVQASDGNWYPEYRIEKVEEKSKEEAPKRTFILKRAPWLDTNAITYLEIHTKSEFPIMRADWFVVNATLEPAYHEFLNFGEDIKGFEKLVFADENLADKARSKTKAVVVSSRVARNNRTLTRSPTFTGGYYWISHDTLKSIDDRNYVQNILREKFDATEVIATLPNGLQAYFVGDAVGKRLDKADNEIARDYTSRDSIVRSARSCIVCHGIGINPIEDEVRILNKKIQNSEEIRLLVTNDDDFYTIQDLFGSNLDLQIVKDQQLYADAIGLATGLSPQENASQYASIWDNYSEELLTKEIIAAECGLTMIELDRYCRLSNDPLFLGLIKNPIRPVRRDQFEQAYQSFMILILSGKQK